MTRCKECLTYSVKIIPTSSRSSFVYQCANPRCRHTSVRTIRIAGDVELALGALQKKRQLSRDALNAGDPDLHDDASG